jgi:hypothetical protein
MPSRKGSSEATAKLIQKIRRFVKNRVEIEGRNSQAKASKEDAEILWEIVNELCELKWDPGYDGHPIQIILNNRSRFEPLHFFPIPYLHKEDTNIDDCIQNAGTNVSIAAGTLNTLLKLKGLGARRDL